MKENVYPTPASSEENPAPVAAPGKEVKIGGGGGSPTRKSLIPVRSPPKGESQHLKIERKPLTPVQGHSHKGRMVGRQSSSTLVASSPPSKKLGGHSSAAAASSSSASASATSKVNVTPTTATAPVAKMSTSTVLASMSKAKRPSSPFSLKKTAPSFSSTPLSSPVATTTTKIRPEEVEVVTNKMTLVDKEVQTDHPDLALITGDEPPPAYWKELAETRRQALEEALTENEQLHQKVEELEKENSLLEEIVAQAKTMAEMIESIEDDSGIAADESVQSTDNSELLATASADDDDEEEDED